MKKYLARLVLEAETPLHVGSGNSDLTLDAPINCDANGLPQINGSSLAGILRNTFSSDEKAADRIFGFQNKDKGEGSRLVISNAHLVYGKGKVVEGLMMPEDIEKDTFLSAMMPYALPLRDHCRIGDKGSAADKGKFDNCVLPKGLRFMCELELTEDKDDISQSWKQLLDLFASPMFRIGGKVRSGLGKLKVNKYWSKEFDFNNEEDKKAYCAHSSSFNRNVEWKDWNQTAETSDKYVCYTLNIQPENFFTFGSGYGDEEVDMTPKKELIVKWNDKGEPTISEAKILVPASSIKGAVSHRVAYHYNKLVGNFAEKFNGLKDDEKPAGTNSKAVQILFGYDKKGKGKAENEVAAGKVFFDDMLIEEKPEEKIFNHVSIDRFTGGAMNGALFDEKVCGNKISVAPIEIYVEESSLKDENVEKAFEKTLDDICSGMLPLGGGTMRGHGCFAGSWTKEGGKNGR